MKLSNLYSRALTIGAIAALLTGCGGSQPPIGATGAMPQRSALGVHSRLHRGFPAVGALIYVSDLILNKVDAYNYPDGGRVLTLTGFTDPAGVCSDTNGNVFVLGNRNDDVIEYAYGATAPTQTLTVPGWAEACSYDPKTGNLAVVLDSQTYGTGVAIFASEHGTPTMYYSGDGTVVWHCGYDNVSDLFCDGQTETVRAAFFVLGDGGNQIQEVPVSGGELYNLSQIQWDDRYMAVVDTSFDTVSRIQFTRGASGNWTGTVVSATTLSRCGYDRPWPSWIYNGTIIVPCTLESPYQSKDKGRVRIWNYPQGGFPIKTIARKNPPNFPDGVTISVPPSR